MQLQRVRPARSSVLAILVAILQLPASFSGAATVPVYSTGFEQPEYDPAFTLAGQNGWVGNDNTSVCNGLFSRFPGLGQHAYIGLFPADPGLTSYAVWRPLSAVPTNTLLRFSVQMAIIDSENGFYDFFRWSVYNIDSQRLFSLDFDNLTFSIDYLLENDSTFISTGQRFTNDILYTLTIVMDLERNLWNASLNNTSLATNQPITRANSRLILGDVDAVWLYGQLDSPGDNYMVFDNYNVTAEVLQPTLTALGRLNNQFLLRLTGELNRDYAIEANTNLNSASWVALRTNNTSTSGSFDFLDTTSSALPRRFYRGRLLP
jgi:hypothetical protein